MIVTNKDGIQTSIVKELQDGKVEVAFSTCNRTKVYTKQAFFSGNTSDYFRTPSGVDSVQYHTGERRRQSNDNIAVIIGGTKKGLVAKDEITGAQAECSYKAFYDGNAFGTGVFRTPEQCMKVIARREKMERKKSEKARKKNRREKIFYKDLMFFKSNEIIAVGNMVVGYIPCIKKDEDTYLCWKTGSNGFTKFNKKQLEAEVSAERFSLYSMDFLVGKIIKLKPFNLNAKILRVGSILEKHSGTDDYNYGRRVPDFEVQLEDGTMLKIKGTSFVDEFKFKLDLFGGILTNMPERMRGTSGEYGKRKVNGKLEKTYNLYSGYSKDSLSIDTIIIYAIGMENGVCMIDFAYAKNVIKTEISEMRGEPYQVVERSNNLTRVKLPLRDFNNYVLEHEFDMSIPVRAWKMLESQKNGK